MLYVKHMWPYFIHIDRNENTSTVFSIEKCSPTIDIFSFAIPDLKKDILPKDYLAARAPRTRSLWHFLKLFLAKANCVAPWPRTSRIPPWWCCVPNIFLSCAILLVDFETKPKQKKNYKSFTFKLILLIKNISYFYSRESTR